MNGLYLLVQFYTRTVLIFRPSAFEMGNPYRNERTIPRKESSLLPRVRVFKVRFVSVFRVLVSTLGVSDLIFRRRVSFIIESLGRLSYLRISCSVNVSFSRFYGVFPSIVTFTVFFRGQRVGNLCISFFKGRRVLSRIATELFILCSSEIGKLYTFLCRFLRFCRCVRSEGVFYLAFFTDLLNECDQLTIMWFLWSIGSLYVNCNLRTKRVSRVVLFPLRVFRED